ncbi:MAG: thiamine phosphate synthase [Candidatus Acidiferrales bacterium]
MLPIRATNPPIVCYVTDRKALETSSSSDRLLATIHAALAAGVDWIQIREKDLAARDLLVLATAAVRAAEECSKGQTVPPRMIVNDRLDVALAAGAAGVHLGSDSVSVVDVVRWCRSGNAPADFLVGVSCHSLQEARQAEAAGASYVFFGPVFDTPSKRSFGRPQGIERLVEVSEAVRIPVVAIGGVNDENAAECLHAGAAGIAAIRLFQQERAATPLAERISKLRG